MDRTSATSGVHCSPGGSSGRFPVSSLSSHSVRCSSFHSLRSKQSRLIITASGRLGLQVTGASGTPGVHCSPSDSSSRRMRISNCKHPVTGRSPSLVAAPHDTDMLAHVFGLVTDSGLYMHEVQ